MIINLETATLEDVAKHYEDAISEACENEHYCDELRDLISECVGDDNTAIVLAYPDAFKAFQEAGFANWDVFVLNTESNIDRLIGAGFDKSEVLAVIANDIFYSSPFSDESPSFLCDTYEKYGSDYIKNIIHNNHPGINESYLDEITDNISGFCDEMSEIRDFLSGNN